MKLFLSFLVVVVSLAAVTLGATSELSDADKDYIAFNEKVLKFSEQIERSPLLKADWNERVRKSGAAPEIPPVEFTCDVSYGRSPERPTSVDRVRPGDIDVVAAFGDSISAGNGLGARVLLEVAIENRGEVWSIGGQGSLEETIVTLPNIIRKYNPELKGYATCKSQKENFEKSWFNVAQPGGKANHMYDQAERLINAMKGDSRVNYAEDWKMLTMFVGGNDLCASCRRNQSAEFWYYSFERALIKLKEEMPRTIVNLVSMFDITPLEDFSTGLACDLLQWGFCDCARNSTTKPSLLGLNLAYDQMYELLANDPRFQSDDFTVIRQPHMRDMTPPIDPETGDYLEGFLSPDCFHPNRIAHQGFAAYLWNTMFIPVGEKPTWFNSSNLAVDIYCPPESNPFIATAGNSRRAASGKVPEPAHRQPGPEVPAKKQPKWPAGRNLGQPVAAAPGAGRVEKGARGARLGRVH